ncbi:hypothetical protein BGY98DRAFT_974617, partial [Russula aff. rugulosa BPL654]
DAFLNPPLPHSWSTLPARSLYRWIYSILTSSSIRPDLLHIRAHTSATDPASLANALVDRLASSSHSLPIPPPLFLFPPFSWIASLLTFLRLITLNLIYLISLTRSSLLAPSSTPHLHPFTFFPRSFMIPLHHHYTLTHVLHPHSLLLFNCIHAPASYLPISLGPPASTLGTRSVVPAVVP